MNETLADDIALMAKTLKKICELHEDHGYPILSRTVSWRVRAGDMQEIIDRLAENKEPKP